MRALFLATPLPDDLATRAREIVDDLRSDAPRRERAERAADVILAMTEESLRYHFRAPMVELGVGMLTRKSLEVALDLAVRGIRGSMRSVLSGFDDDQLAKVADFIEARLYPDPHG